MQQQYPFVRKKSQHYTYMKSEKWSLGDLNWPVMTFRLIETDQSWPFIRLKLTNHDLSYVAALHLHYLDCVSCALDRLWLITARTCSACLTSCHNVVVSFWFNGLQWVGSLALCNNLEKMSISNLILLSSFSLSYHKVYAGWFLQLYLFYACFKMWLACMHCCCFCCWF